MIKVTMTSELSKQRNDGSTYFTCSRISQCRELFFQNLSLKLFSPSLICIGNSMFYIEITSWKARAYGIFTRVGEVSEIERVSAANEWDFWCKTNECENPVHSAFHAVICLFYTYWDFFYLSSFNWFSKIITKLLY